MAKNNQAPATQVTAPVTAKPAPGTEKKTGGHGGAIQTHENKKSNVIALPGMCMADGCKLKSAKANFCMEHFDWFKEGLITKEGVRPTDFEKKYFNYQRRLQGRKAA